MKANSIRKIFEIGCEIVELEKGLNSLKKISVKKISALKIRPIIANTKFKISNPLLKKQRLLIY